MISAADILRGKVLIVDDKAANVLLLERMLRGAGYLSIHSTMHGEQVCELHLEHQFDLILLDLEMPGMDGFAVMENLKEIEADSYLPVLVITAQPSHKLRALKAGAKDFVSKPFDLSEVLIRVHNMLEVRLLHRQTRSLYEELIAERTASERMLKEVLPTTVSEWLSVRPAGPVAVDIDEESSEIITEGYAEVTVLFADIVEFTRFAEGASAEVLVGVLGDFSDRFDQRAEWRVVDQERAMGDAYLATAELRPNQADQTMGAAKKALAFVRALDRFNERSRYKLRVRIGLETSKTDGAVVRKRRALFDL